MTKRIYLDNAATSWPKPESVYVAVDDYLRRLGAPAGRGVYQEATEVERLVADCRLRAARLFGAAGAESIVFTLNATDALNQAIHGWLRPGDHVITTMAEHNSVLRPLRWLEEHADVAVDRLTLDAQGTVDPQRVEDAIRPDTRLIVVTTASNVTGVRQPVEAIAELAGRREVTLLLDAAQTVGHVPIDVQALQVGLVAAAGHKGLLGPLGTGLLYIRPDLATRLQPTRQGGTGTRSNVDRQPESLPDRFEAGNLNVAGLAGLRAGLEFVQRQPVDVTGRQVQQLTQRLLDGLQMTRGVTIYGPADARQQVGVVSITVEGYDPQEVAGLLDQVHRIAVRPGFHCAPCMHDHLGTATSGGTVRISIGPFNTPNEIDTAIAAIGELSTMPADP